MKFMEVENIYNNEEMEVEEMEVEENNEDYMEVEEEDLFNDEIIKAKIAMILFIYQTNGTIANNNYNSIDDLIEDISNKVYNTLTQQLIFVGDYDTAFNRELHDVVEYHVRDYFMQ